MLIGIGHVQQVGKSTAAQALCRDLGFKEFSFAQPLKDLAFEADPIIFNNAMTNVGVGRGRLKWLVQSVGGWDQAKVQYPEVRRFLQDLGLGARKVFGEDFWVQQAMARAFDGTVVYSDVRFTNEFDAIKNLGGKVIRINRPGRMAQGHVSETELLSIPDEDWDAVIDNNGQIIDLEQKVVELVRDWLKTNLFADGPQASVTLPEAVSL